MCAIPVKKGQEVLDHFKEYMPKFKKIIPGDYKRMLQLSSQFEEQGMSRQEAQIEAFYAVSAAERNGRKQSWGNLQVFGI